MKNNKFKESLQFPTNIKDQQDFIKNSFIVMKLRNIFLI